MKERTLIRDLGTKVGEEVVIKGWIDVRRDQGKMVFFDFRDFSGKVQGVVLPASAAMDIAKECKSEYVVEVTGKVNARPERNIVADKLNGNIELEILAISIINTCETPPFPIDADTILVDEQSRLKYRYLDLRTERMQKNIRARSTIQRLCREYLLEREFVEVETPLMSASTPEGSRSFVVPSRLSKGSSYALPQSPQQYKQLLMVAGFERYFQFARCMRDEDTRGDRQPEFTQLDMEMSFVTPEDIMSLNEELLIKVVKELYPHKKIQEVPFPRMTYAEAMKNYGNDRPDIRSDKNDPDLLAFLWVVDFPAFEKTGSDNVDETGEWTFTHNPFSRPKEESVEDFRAKRNIESLITTQYDITLNGLEIGGGSIRNHEPEMQNAAFEIMGYSAERIHANFGHLMDALKFGAPPHGGIAWGFERFVMILENEPNIREVIAFAKTGEGRDLMMGAPSEISKKQLDELGLELKKKN